MVVLFHPAHRKFIKLLRLYADRVTYINVTDLDKERIKELFLRTSKAYERHMSLYRLALEILNRNTSAEEGYAFTHEMVDAIEKTLVQAERRKTCSTFQGIFIMPLLQFLIKKMR